MRRKKEEEHEAREHMLEEEAKAQKAREEEAAALEFDKWRGEFSVDAEGTTEAELQDGNQDLLYDFVEYIKKQKCVPLEDIAAEFKLRTQECINRITSLESMGMFHFHTCNCALLSHSLSLELYNLILAS
ncbi:DDRGK domain-containing protein [Cephalotus follicularis]|uniref:DDRGK domain-containing protein n=1 Tax=Cephalotus follicularis TaxID=3775 RepID=A0A1Q3CB73_CEPFO|nr:DDRGK domain-containing protein [Cephalotus follicularis]